MADDVLIAALLYLVFAHCAPTVIQAEERGNVTLTWLLPLEADAPLASLYIDIWTVKLEELCRVYLYDDQYQDEPHQDELYRRRVRCDLELAKHGRIECLFRDLRLDDTGNYTCIAGFDQEHFNRGAQSLRVTEAEHETSEPVGRSRVMIPVCLSWFVAVIGLLCYFVAKCNNSATSCVNSMEAARPLPQLQSGPLACCCCLSHLQVIPPPTLMTH
nr:uncharacterized protein LOC120822846 isoform X2 [Gasterosteus aculeatus aculeatus]XP_040038725.1 uncharacterized protein LOC120822846 isoform X2 [Gasterosteus aculeatus aculeatus]